MTNDLEARPSTAATEEKPTDLLEGEEYVRADDRIIGTAFRWSLGVIVLIGLGILLTVYFVRKPAELAPPSETALTLPQTAHSDIRAPKVRFTDVTLESGIDFVHENGGYGDKLLPESMGGGNAFFDFDNDGDQDLLFVNSTYWPGKTPKGQRPPTSRLYQNDGTGSFKDVTEDAGLDIGCYGTGVAVGDYDNDGHVDVYIAAVGGNRLFRNIGGRFEEVTAVAGVAGTDTEWSTSTGFLDYDNDGLLDLFVCNYVRWSKDIDFAVDYRLVGVGRAYGPPMNYEGTYPYLYHNNGDGTFTDLAEPAGLHVNNPATRVPIAKSLGVMPVDINRDGWLDIFVANDTVQNFLYVNQTDGTFAERAIDFGLAYDRNGSATGAMGVDIGQYRNDAAVGIFIGNFANEMTSVYASQGETALFADEAIGEGIGSPSRLMLTFGLFLFDYDLDGRLDLLQANGHLEEEINIVQPSQHYEQAAQLFWNAGSAASGTFVAVEPGATGDLGTPIVGRGASFADIDLDGDLDVLLTQTGRRPLLLRNDQSLDHHWVRVRLIGDKCNKNAIGAVVTLNANNIEQRRQVMPTRSYLSQVELPITFGLGQADGVKSLQVDWPHGASQVFDGIPIDREITVHQTRGLILK